MKSEKAIAEFICSRLGVDATIGELFNAYRDQILIEEAKFWEKQADTAEKNGNPFAGYQFTANRLRDRIGESCLEAIKQVFASGLRPEQPLGQIVPKYFMRSTIIEALQKADADKASETQDWERNTPTYFDGFEDAKEFFKLFFNIDKKELQG